MSRDDRQKRSLLGMILGRKRRETRRVGRNRVVQTGQSHKSKTFKQQFRLLRHWFKSSKSDALQADQRKKADEISLTSIIRSVTRSKIELVEERQSASTSQSITGKNVSRTKKIRKTLFRNSRRILYAVPALVFALICLKMILNLLPQRVTSQVAFANRFDRAMQNQNLGEAELLVKNQISGQRRPGDQDLYRYALVMANSQKYQKTREIFEFLTDGISRSFGPAHLELARAYSSLPKQSEQTAAKIESHLIKAMVNSDTEAIARLSLGRLYRSRGRFRDAESMLDPIRSYEEACLELGLVRNAQGEYDDIPTTLAPFMTRWREQWANPADASQFQHAAIGMILMNEEASVVASLDSPKTPIPQTQLDEIRRLALGLYMGRLLREGPAQYSKVLEIIEKQQDKLPCSPIWINPVMQLTANNSPVRAKALSLREKMTNLADCDPAFLHEFAVLGRNRGESDFARAIYEKILQKYPDEVLSLNNLAMMLIEVEPKNPKRALALIEPLIHKYPDFLEIYDTRGQIEQENGQPREAIEDFLKALPVYCLKPEFHLRLARAYRSIKDETNARVHEEVANELSGIQ